MSNTTITTATYRSWAPWEKGGQLGGEDIYRSVTSGTPYSQFITAEEHEFHAAQVAEQDAKIEAFKREVLGETEENRSN